MHSRVGGVVGCRLPTDAKTALQWRKLADAENEQYGIIDSCQVLKATDSGKPDWAPHYETNRADQIAFHTHPAIPRIYRPPSAHDLLACHLRCFKWGAPTVEWVIEGDHIYEYRTTLEASKWYAELFGLLTPADKVHVLKTGDIPMLWAPIIEDWDQRIQDIFTEATRKRVGPGLEGYRKALSTTYSSMGFRIFLLRYAPFPKPAATPANILASILTNALK